jgi:hypothetical protein
MLRIEMGGPSAVAVVSVMCRLAKIKRPGALALRPDCFVMCADAALSRCAGQLYPYQSRATAASSSAPPPWTCRQARPSCDEASKAAQDAL